MRIGVAKFGDELSAGLHPGGEDQAAPFAILHLLDEPGAQSLEDRLVVLDRDRPGEDPRIRLPGHPSGEARGKQPDFPGPVPEDIFVEPGALHLLLLGKGAGEIEHEAEMASGAARGKAGDPGGSRAGRWRRPARCLIFAGMYRELAAPRDAASEVEVTMRLALLLALQGSPEAPVAPIAIDFDLARLKPSDPCATGGAGSDIVVCGRRPRADFDMEKWERVFAISPLLAEKGIGPGAVARAYVESVGMPGGQVSKRAMVGVKIGF